MIASSPWLRHPTPEDSPHLRDRCYAPEAEVQGRAEFQPFDYDEEITIHGVCQRRVGQYPFFAL